MRAETTPQLKLPTLPYTPEQLFFIAFGQVLSHYSILANSNENL